MIYRFIDIETYCDLDLKTVGRKKYMEHHSFYINLVGWVDVETSSFEDLRFVSMDNLEFKQIDSDCHRNIEKQLLKGFFDKNIIHVAHNALFEIESFEKILGITIDLKRWVCTMVKSYQTGLPGSLSIISKVLKLESSKVPGVNLIKYFAKPCKPTKANGGRERNLPEHNPEKWEEYKYYNKYDVLSIIELSIKVLSSFPQPSFEHLLWIIDHAINKKGINLDLQLIHNAVNYIERFTSATALKLKELTGLDNPNSNIQFKNWLQENNLELFISSVDKDHLKDYYQLTKDPRVKEVITLKQASGKTSLKKYDKLMNTMYENKVFDILQFTATGTGRWAGRNFQIHNLPKNKLGKDLDIIRSAYKNNDRPLSTELPFELSQLLRTVLIPKEGYKFMVADYSAIEARVAAWIAEEKWVVEAFKNGRDIYKETASRMFDIPYENISNYDRQDGKVAVLACGYGGGNRAIANFAPDWEEEKRQAIVDYYRQANKNIVSTWRQLERAIHIAINDKKRIKLKKLDIFYKKGCLVIQLPSNRQLIYVRAKSKDGNITYEEMTNNTWGATKTYGGKLFENIVQAIARDILAYALVNIHGTYNTKFHVHDEIIVEIPIKEIKEDSVKEFCDKITELPNWAEGLPMKAEGFITNYYMKEE